MIDYIQISPFDYCNNKCWYCPVKHYEQPKEYITHMSPELFEKIIAELVSEENKYLISSSNTIYTGQYNEIILYKYLREMLATFRKFNLQTVILSNGIALTEDKLELLREYEEVITQIHFNCPSFDLQEWARDTGSNEEAFPLENIKRVAKVFGNKVIVGMNGIDAGEMNSRVEHAREIIKDTFVFPVVDLCDRSGLLKDLISNEAEIEENSRSDNEEKKHAVGCKQNRIGKWLHINALGKTFICCNDYFFEYEFGDLSKQKLTEILGSVRQCEAIERAYNNLCRECVSAIWR